MPRMSIQERAQAVGMIQAGQNKTQGDLQVKFSQVESKLHSLTQRVKQDEENSRQKDITIVSLQRQVDNLKRLQQNVTELEDKNRDIKDVIEKVQLWNETFIPKRFARSSDPTEVAFYAELSHELNDVPVHSTIKFDNLIHRTGSTFDVNTGIFTCPTSGLYLFSVFIESNSVNTEAIVGLMKEGTHYMNVISERFDAVEDDTGGNVCLLSVNKGEQLWVETYGNDKQSFWPSFTTFSGVLIHRH